MAVRIVDLPIGVPGVRARRWTIDALHIGVKETYVIARVERGRSEWSSGGKVWRSGPGALQLQQPGDVCRDVARDGPSKCQIVMLSPSLVEDAIGKVRVHPQIDAGDERGAAFQRLHDAVRDGADRLALEVAVTEAIESLARAIDVTCMQSPPVRRAVELLRARVSEGVTLDDLAAHAGLDKFHLCRAFRAQVGVPPHAYLTRVRVRRAQDLLEAGKRPSEVAHQVGFYDQSQLNRHFRRIVGTTPGRYARSA